MMRHHVRILSASLVTLACAGAASDRDRSADASMATRPTIRDSAGITIVENAEPQWPDGSGWHVGALLTSVGLAEGEPAQELYHAFTATRLSDGTVAVGNSGSGEIRFFRQDGTFLRSVGTTGGGPGEFRGTDALRALRHVAGDTLIAWDIYAQTASVFAPNGEFVRSYRLDGPARQHFFVGIFEDRSLQMLLYEPTWTRDMPAGVHRDSITLLEYGVDHRLANTIGGISGSDEFVARWGPWGMMSTDPPFGRTTSVTVGGDRTCVATGDANEIAVYDQARSLRRIIRRTTAPIAVTPEMIDRDRARRMAEEAPHLEKTNVDRRVIRMIAELPYPSVLPPYGRTVLDAELNLWVEEFRAAADDPADWSVFDGTGIWLGRVTLPDGLAVYEIGPDYILGRSVDDVGVERIEVHALVKN